MLLAPAEREHATHIYRALRGAVELARSRPVEEVKAWVSREIDADELLSLDYFEIVDSMSLRPITSWEEKGEKIGCVAVRVGNVRLIDNVVIA
jgi:pantoate--beta-alanine ligase